MTTLRQKRYLRGSLADNPTIKTELVTTLKHQTTRILADLHSSREHLLITEHGQLSTYQVDVDDYEQMSARVALLEGITRGEQAIQIG